jgi:hypothetical protein
MNVSRSVSGVERNAEPGGRARETASRCDVTVVARSSKGSSVIGVLFAFDRLFRRICRVTVASPAYRGFASSSQLPSYFAGLPWTPSRRFSSPPPLHAATASQHHRTNDFVHIPPLRVSLRRPPRLPLHCRLPSMQCGNAVRGCDAQIRRHQPTSSRRMTATPAVLRSPRRRCVCAGVKRWQQLEGKAENEAWHGKARSHSPRRPPPQRDGRYRADEMTRQRRAQRRAALLW